MRRALGLAAVCWVSVAGAQSGPVVKENTGDLRYVYPIQLPAARGRVQPALALVYSSEVTADRGYGYGWNLSPFYVEQKPATTAASSEYFLVRGEQRDTVTAREENEYLVYSLGEPLEIRRSGTDADAGWILTDGVGAVYSFSRRCGRRWYLTSVVDLDQNVAQYDYGAGCDGGLQAVSYDLTRDPGTPRDPDAFAHRVSFEPEPNPFGSIVPRAT